MFRLVELNQIFAWTKNWDSSSFSWTEWNRTSNILWKSGEPEAEQNYKNKQIRISVWPKAPNVVRLLQRLLQKESEWVHETKLKSGRMCLFFVCPAFCTPSSRGLGLGSIRLDWTPASSLRQKPPLEQTINIIGGRTFRAWTLEKWRGSMERETAITVACRLQEQSRYVHASPGIKMPLFRVGEGTSQLRI